MRVVRGGGACLPAVVCPLSSVVPFCRWRERLRERWRGRSDEYPASSIFGSVECRVSSVEWKRGEDRLKAGLRAKAELSRDSCVPRAAPSSSALSVFICVHLWFHPLVASPSPTFAKAMAGRPREAELALSVVGRGGVEPPHSICLSSFIRGSALPSVGHAPPAPDPSLSPASAGASPSPLIRVHQCSSVVPFSSPSVGGVNDYVNGGVDGAASIQHRASSIRPLPYPRSSAFAKALADRSAVPSSSSSLLPLLPSAPSA